MLIADGRVRRGTRCLASAVSDEMSGLTAWSGSPGHSPVTGAIPVALVDQPGSGSDLRNYGAALAGTVRSWMSAERVRGLATMSTH